MKTKLLLASNFTREWYADAVNRCGAEAITTYCEDKGTDIQCAIIIRQCYNKFKNWNQKEKRMKQNKIFGAILCLVLLCCITACGSGTKKKKEGSYPDFLINHDWEYNTLSCTEILHFYEDGGFSYYEACGNPVGNSDCYETYSYDEATGIVTAYGYDDSVEDMEIVVLRYTKDSLLVSIEGAIKEFYTYSDVPSVNGDMYDKVEGYSAYVAIGDINEINPFCKT